jgi:hypothetical protein
MVSRQIGHVGKLRSRGAGVSGSNDVIEDKEGDNAGIVTSLLWSAKQLFGLWCPFAELARSYTDPIDDVATEMSRFCDQVSPFCVSVPTGAMHKTSA